MVPGVGIEPTRPEGHGILSPERLPIPPPRHAQILPILPSAIFLPTGRTLMPHWRSARSILCATALVASPGCATLPKISMTSNCGAGWQPAVRIRAVDKRGEIIPYAEVTVISDDRSTGYKTWTSSLGEARFALAPGSYRLSVDQHGQWQGASRSFTMHRDCQVDMQAQLIPHDIFPLDGPVVRRTR